LSACDLGKPGTESAVGPALHAVAVYPADGQGEDCGPRPANDCGVPVDAPIEIRFDRYLLPKTASRQSITIFSGAEGNTIFLAPSYDVLERVVTYRGPYGQLAAGVVYQVELPLPDEDKDGFGFRAFDGAGLKKGRVPLTWSFRTSRAVAPASRPDPAPSCDEALKVFQGGGCARCHTDHANAPFGLSLASAIGVRDTALGQPSHETSTWARPGDTLVDPARFGTGMPLIEPGDPGTSYLIYKLLENPANFGPDGGCFTSHSVALPPGQCQVASRPERARLADWFVDGDPMPPGKEALSGGIDDLKTLVRFINGATDACN
jgi:hypothetical protein